MSANKKGDNMTLNDREKQILGAIIDYYLDSGETIGSRTLVKKYDLDISSATVRNAMADLEDMGYIMKTHTSSGRVQTDIGYKFYLNELLKIREITKNEKEKIELAYERKMNELDGILEHTSRLLSKLTSYTSIVFEPTTDFEKVKKVQLVHVNNYSVMCVIVLDNSGVKTRKLHLDASINEEELFVIQKEITKRINENEHAYSLQELELIFAELIYKGSENLVEEDDSNSGLFIRGTENILSTFENKPLELMQAVKIFDKHKDLKKMFENAVKEREYEAGKVHILFGDELNIPILESFSFVFSVYHMGESKGIIGVLGPKRMEYAKTVGLIKHVTDEVNKIIQNIEDSRGEG